MSKRKGEEENGKVYVNTKAILCKCCPHHFRPYCFQRVKSTLIRYLELSLFEWKHFKSLMWWNFSQPLINNFQTKYLIELCSQSRRTYVNLTHFTLNFTQWIERLWFMTRRTKPKSWKCYGLVCQAVDSDLKNKEREQRLKTNMNKEQYLTFSSANWTFLVFGIRPIWAAVRCLIVAMILMCTGWSVVHRNMTFDPLWAPP